MAFENVTTSPEPDLDLLRIGSILEGELPGLSEPEWKQVANRAVEERLGPLVLTRIRGNPTVPETVSNQLRSAYYNTSALNLLIYRELARLLKLSADQTLAPPILLKGGALASSLYESIALRPMCDLDLLVRPEDLERFLEVARELGYRRLSPEMAPGLSAATHYQIALGGGPANTVLMEFHWSLVGGHSDLRAPDLGWFFEQTESWSPPSELADTTCSAARQLTPTALLLYLSAHAILQHGDPAARAIWFYDLHKVVRERDRDIDWETVVEKAQAFGWSGTVHRALERARELFGTRLPVEALGSLARTSASEGKSAAHLRVKQAPRGRAEMVWAEMACLTPGRRLQLALAILFPSPAYLKWRYPAARRLWPVCYPYRWGIVVREASRALWRGLPAPRVAPRSTSS